MSASLIRQGDTMADLRLPFRSRLRFARFDLSVRQRLALGFGFVLALVCTTTALTWLQLDDTARRMHALGTQEARVAELAGRMLAEVNSGYAALLSSVVLTEPEDLAEQKQLLAHSMQSYAEL